MEKLSVIICTYNGEKTLDAAINSVKEISSIETDIIVVDDGSTDNTKELFKNRSDITYIYQENQGPGPARNRGLRESSGKYITFLDADDTLNSINFQLENNDVTVYKVKRIIYKNGAYTKAKLWKPNIWNNSNVNIKLEQLSDTISTGKIYRKSFLIENNIAFKSGLYEDVDFMYQVYVLNPSIKYIKEHLYNWNVQVGGQSITNRFTSENLLERLNSYTNSLEKLNSSSKNYIVSKILNIDFRVYFRNWSTVNNIDKKNIYSQYVQFVSKYCSTLDALNLRNYTRKLIKEKDNFQKWNYVVEKIAGLSKWKSAVNSRLYFLINK